MVNRRRDRSYRRGNRLGSVLDKQLGVHSRWVFVVYIPNDHILRKGTARDHQQ